MATVCGYAKQKQYLEANVTDLFTKFLVQTMGEPEMCKRLHNGNYHVKCTSQDQSDKFLSISQIGSIEVETFPHKRLIEIKGVITSEIIYSNSDEEVHEWLGLRVFLVTSIYRFPRRQTLNGTKVGEEGAQ